MSNSKNRCSLTLIEFLILLCVILIFWGVFAVYADIHLRTLKEKVLRYELNNIRMSVELYRIIRGELPKDLISLINQEFTLETPEGIILKKKFLRPIRVDKEGYLLDPFMNRYVYAPKDGEVSSSTKGYENW